MEFKMIAFGYHITFFLDYIHINEEQEEVSLQSWTSNYYG